MTVPELVAQALQNLLLGLLRAVVEKCYGDLQIVPHTLLAHDAEIHLLLHPAVHDVVQLPIRCADAEGSILLPIPGLRRPQGFFRCRLLGVPFG